MTTKEKQKRLVEAAKRVSNNPWPSCSAIACVGASLDEWALKKEYAAFYNFEKHLFAPFANDEPCILVADHFSPQAQLARSLALLFYAEVIADD